MDPQLLILTLDASHFFSGYVVRKPQSWTRTSQQRWHPPHQQIIGGKPQIIKIKKKYQQKAWGDLTKTHDNNKEKRKEGNPQ